MTALPRLKARVKVNFPARVSGGTGISVDKWSGEYTIGLDVNELIETSPINDENFANFYLLAYDEQNDEYTKLDLDNLSDAVALDFPVSDDDFVIQDDADATKQLKFQVSGVTTGTTRTISVPDANTTLVGTDASQALTNKTYNGLTVTSTTGTLTIAAGKTVTVSNTLSFSGTDGSSIAFGAGGTVAYTSNNLSAFASTTSAQLAGVISDETGSGALVFASSPTLVSPALGTPSSVNLANATGLPISTGVSGLGTGVATALAINVGSAGAPVVLNGDGGTPSSLTLTNATGLPVSSGISGLASGAATFLATPSSANLRALLTDEVGTGEAYFVGGALGTPASATLTNATDLPLSGLSVQAAYTVVANSTSSSAAPTAVSISALTTKVSPAAGDYLLLSDGAASGALKKVDATSLGSAGSVSSIAGNTGAFTLSTGITNSTNDIRLTVGQLPGTATNDNASAGNMGEYASSTVASGSAVSLTSTTANNITSISLTAGDWDVSSVVYFIPSAATVSQTVTSISTTSATLNTTAGNFTNLNFAITDETSATLPPIRFSLSGTTTVYLVARATYSGGSVKAYGIIRARRVR